MVGENNLLTPLCGKRGDGMKKPEDMTQKELKDWSDWAKEEILEYQDFIKELNKYIKR